MTHTESNARLMSFGRDVLPDWLASRAASSPEHVALVAGARSWTFRALDAEVTRTASRLADLGVREGVRVATLLENGPAAAVLPHAVLRLGATIVPLNIRLSASELAWQLADAAPGLLVADQRTLERAQDASVSIAGLITTCLDRDGLVPFDAPVDLDTPLGTRLRLVHPLDAVLAIIYTSGTTGQPKGTMLTVGNFWWSAIGSALNLGVHRNDSWLACLPLFHVGGLSIVLRSAIYGTTCVVHETFDAEAVNASIDDGTIAVVSVVAVMLQRMLDLRGARRYPPSLRCVLVGGGPAPESLLHRCAALGVPVVQTYGLTEACSQVATLSLDDARAHAGSAGRVLYPNELRIATSSSGDDDGDDAGEILVRGPIVMAGYAGQAEASARAIVDGWLHTGDIGRLDADGYLFVLDRRDDLIITGGENVYPAEVESVLLAHASVVEAGVIGVADAQWGQRIVAVVRTRGGMSEPEQRASILAMCRARLARYKVPSELRFVTAPLPRTASGKLRRAELRALVPDGG
ncbi:MAG: o-succinylbenzoate--CoA ligase [Gemmatimonadaceae bacterium]